MRKPALSPIKHKPSAYKRGIACNPPSGIAFAPYRIIVPPSSSGRIAGNSFICWKRLCGSVVGIGVVESGDEADVDQIAVHPVDPTAAERVGRQRRPEGVDHVTRGEAPGRNPPEFLDTDRVDLRIAVAVEPEPRDRDLGQRAPRALSEHDDLRQQVRSGLEIRLGAAVGGDALVAHAHADDAVAFPQQLLTGKGREHVDPGSLRLGAEPFGEAIEGGHVLAVVVEDRRREGRRDLAARR